MKRISKYLWVNLGLLFAMTCIIGELRSQDVLGIDVYNGTGSIDWFQVSASGKEFSWVKATEGYTWDDVSFDANMINGENAGVTMGAYHFARPDNNSAANEVDHFVEVAGEYIGPCYLPPALDLEDPSATIILENIFSSSELTNWVTEWLEGVHSATGVAPVIYTNSNYANYLTSSLDTDIYKLWIADPDGDPNSNPTNLGIWDDWVVKQYSWFGSVPGISGNTDLNVFNGNFNDFDLLTNCGEGIPNDDCFSATFISSNSSCNYTSATVNGATPSGEPQASCDAYSGGTPHLNDVWFGFYVTCPGTHTIQIDPAGNETFNVNFLDAVVEVYASCNLSPIACADDTGGGGGFTDLTVNGLGVGTPYYIRVYDYGSQNPSNGDFEICVTHEEPCPDDCPDADGCGFVGTNYGNVTPSDIGWTVELLDYVWGGDHYTLDVQQGCSYTVTMCGTTTFDTQITIFNEENCEIAYNDDFCDLSSEVTFTADNNASYTVQINEYYCSTNNIDAEYFAVTWNSCGSNGCTDPNACNYCTNCTIDDNSCLYPGCNDNNACNYNPIAGCYDGSCTYPGCNDNNACNYNPIAGCDDGSCTYPGCIDNNACNYNPNAGCGNGSCTYPGCNDDNACNYNPIAGCGDGSCTYPGCNEDEACNYNPNAGCDDGSCVYPVLYYNCDGDCLNDADADGVCDELEVNGCIDPEACNYNPDATNDDGSCIMIGDTCDDGDPDTNNDVIQSDCDCQGVEDGVINGCTDPEGCNYNSDATNDDGSCIMIGDTCDDGDSDTNNDVIQSDCDCEGEQVINGCTDSEACNYNPDALNDDGSCIMVGDTCDDGDPNTDNDVIQSDCECEGEQEGVINGCTDPEGCNYNSDATNDDGSCEYVDTYTIVGNQAPLSLSEETYFYTNTPGSNYDWDVDNGALINGQGTPTVIVVWNDGIVGLICVTETNEDGCQGDTICLDITTDVSIYESDQFGITIYPNPVSNELVIEPEQYFTKEINLEMIDGIGRIILSKSFIGKTTLDVSAISPGAYSIRLVTYRGIIIKKVIVEK